MAKCKVEYSRDDDMDGTSELEEALVEEII